MQPVTDAGSGPCQMKYLLPERPVLKLGKEDFVDVLVSHVEQAENDWGVEFENVVIFYVQPLVYEHSINYMSIRLSEFYNIWMAHNEMVVTDIETVRQGDCYAAKWPEDDAWYRCVVRQRIDHVSVMVLFCDYGNSCALDLSTLRHLPHNLHINQVPPLSICCTDVNSRRDVTNWFKERYEAAEFTLQIKSIKSTGDSLHDSLFVCNVYQVDSEGPEDPIDWSAKLLDTGRLLTGVSGDDDYDDV